MRDYFRNRQVLGSIRQLDVVVPSFFPKTGLVAYYKLDGNSNDAHGSNNGTDTKITYSLANGKIDQGAGFNQNSNSKIVFSSSIIPIGAKSISVWIKNVQSSHWCAIIRTNYSGGSSYGFSMNYTGVCEVSRASSSNKVLSIFPTMGLNDGNWHHVVFVWDGTTNTNAVKIYVDGVLNNQTTANYTEVNTPSHPLTLGQYDTNYDYTGAMDELGIWNRALTSDEITKLYNNGNGLTY